MKDTVGADVEVKASGGVRNLEDFNKMVEAGATYWCERRRSNYARLRSRFRLLIYINFGSDSYDKTI